MQTAEEILKTIHKGYSRSDFGLSGSRDVMEYWQVDKILLAMKEYARQASEETRKRCAESAKIRFHDGTTKENSLIKYFQSGADNLQVDKDWILATPLPELI